MATLKYSVLLCLVVFCIVQEAHPKALPGAETPPPEVKPAEKAADTPKGSPPQKAAAPAPAPAPAKPAIDSKGTPPQKSAAPPAKAEKPGSPPQKAAVAKAPVNKPAPPSTDQPPAKPEIGSQPRIAAKSKPPSHTSVVTGKPPAKKATGVIHKRKHALPSEG